MHTNAWNNASPLGSEFASSIDNHMRAMKLDTSERMGVAFIWNQSQEWDGYPVSLPFRGLDDLPLIYTHQPSALHGAADAGMIELEQTWNTTGKPAALWIGITDTASPADAMFFEFVKDDLPMAAMLKTGVLVSKGVTTDHLECDTANFAGAVVFNGSVEFNSTVGGGITTDNMHITGNLTVGGAVDFANGLQAGSLNVEIIDATGKIPAISEAYFTDVSGVHITGVGLLEFPNAWVGRQDFTGYTEGYVPNVFASGNLTVDRALGSVFGFTHSAPITTMSISNITPGYVSFVLLVTASGTPQAWSWFDTVVKWAGNIVPPRTATAGRTDKWYFWTVNEGVTWHGTEVMKNFIL